MLNNLLGGMTVAFGVLGTIAVANVITSYLLPNGQTIQEFIGARTGLNTEAI